MNTECPICQYDLQELQTRLSLGGERHSLYCPVCGSVIVETAEFPGCFYDEQNRTYVIWNLELQRPSGAISAERRFNAFELAITGQAVNPQDLCYPQMVVFQHSEETVLAYSGIKPEFYRFLKPNLQAMPQWSPPHYTFSPPLRGDFVVTIRRRALLSQTEPAAQPGLYRNGTALNVWPNFRRQGWQNYFVYFASSDPNVILQSLRVLGTGGEETKFPGPTARGEVSYVPAFIELHVIDQAGLEYWSTYKVELEEVPAPAGGADEKMIPILALDFGTSNTCFAIKFSAANTSATQVVSFQDRTKQLIRGFSVEDALTFPWFPEIPGAHAPPNQLPSELSFNNEISGLGSELQEFQPIAQYTIPPFTRYREGEENFVLGEFKWRQALLEPLKPFAYALQYLYLRLAFRLALAEVVSDPRCQRTDRINLVATCPLAFGVEQRDKFRETLMKVREDILRRTGINLVLQKIYDESHAGEAGAGQPPGTFETIYVDVGGGTTDVGFFRFERAGAQSQERAIYLDSMQYAGDDVWNAITRNNLSEWGAIRFEREVRGRPVTALFDDRDLEPFQYQRSNLDKARIGTEKFVDGLIEYITRMIAARESIRTDLEGLDGPLGIYLLGNGWRFIEVLKQDYEAGDVGQAISDFIAEGVKDRLQQYGLGVPQLTVIYPIVSGINPKTAVAIGAALLYVGESAGRIPPEPEFTLRSFLGSDLNVFTPGKELIDWKVTIPHQLPAGTIVRSINYHRHQPFSFERDQINGQHIDAINLLEKVLTSSGGRANIGRNVFAYYLEEWHKQLLV